MAHRRGQLGGHQPHVGGEPGRRVGPEPEVLAQPVRMGEVVEGDQRGEPAVHAAVDDRPVAGQRRPVDGAARRHHPGPLDAEAEAVAPERGRPVQRLLGAVPEPDGVARRGHPSRLLPRQPVVGRLAGAVDAALDLEAGGRHPEQEPVGHQAAAPGGHADRRRPRPWYRIACRHRAALPSSGPGPPTGPLQPGDGSLPPRAGTRPAGPRPRTQPCRRPSTPSACPS